MILKHNESLNSDNLTRCAFLIDKKPKLIHFCIFWTVLLQYLNDYVNSGNYAVYIVWRGAENAVWWWWTSRDARWWLPSRPVRSTTRPTRCACAPPSGSARPASTRYPSSIPICSSLHLSLSTSCQKILFNSWILQDLSSITCNSIVSTSFPINNLPARLKRFPILDDLYYPRRDKRINYSCYLLWGSKK